jgi:hypothetical protein
MAILIPGLDSSSQEFEVKLPCHILSQFIEQQGIKNRTEYPQVSINKAFNQMAID